MRGGSFELMQHGRRGMRWPRGVGRQAERVRGETESERKSRDGSRKERGGRAGK